MEKTPRELRALLRDCGFQVRRARGHKEIWEHPAQRNMQVIVTVVGVHTGRERKFRRGLMVYL